MSKWKKRGRGCLVIAGGTVIFLSLAGLVYQAMKLRSDAANYPPPGRMVAMGDYQMHIQETGNAGPVVVLEAGMGHNSLIWFKVQEEIGTFARVVSYDRAGTGWSEVSPQPRDSNHIAAELKTLLTKANVEGPYIMVGHSLGGLYVRSFAHAYPEDVAGMVLIDATHEEQFERFPKELMGSMDTQLKLMGLAGKFAPFGVVRLLGLLESRSLSDNLKAAADATSNRNHVLGVMVEEFSNLNASSKQVQKAGTLGNIPLVVLTGEQEDDPEMSPELNKQFTDLWIEMQKELSQLSGDSQWKVVEGSGHMIQLTRPEAVIEAIRAVVDKVNALQVGATED